MSTLAKFSELTDQLEEINSIRKAAVGAQIRRVINLVDKRRQALTPNEINKACHVDVNGNKAVFDSLQFNPKVRYEGGRFSYKRELEKNGMKPATDTAKRRASAEFKALNRNPRPRRRRRNLRSARGRS